MRLLKSWRELVLRLWAHYADFSLPRLWLEQISKRSILLEFSYRRSSTALSASILEPTFLHCLPEPPAAPYHTAHRFRRCLLLRWRAAPAHSSPPLRHSCRCI